MPIDTHLYLTSRGWKGKGNALREGGLDRPVVQAQKKDLRGVGNNRDDGFQFWDHVFVVAANGIKVVVHKDDDHDDDNNDDNNDDSKVTSSLVDEGGLKGSRSLELTQTGILSNRSPNLRSNDSNRDAGVNNVAAMADSKYRKGDLLSLAKREAAKRELYSRFCRGGVIFDDQPGPVISNSIDGAERLSPAGTNEKGEEDGEAERRRRKEEKRMKKVERREKRRLKDGLDKDKAKVKRRK